MRKAIAYPSSKKLTLFSSLCAIQEQGSLFKKLTKMNPDAHFSRKITKSKHSSLRVLQLKKPLSLIR